MAFLKGLHEGRRTGRAADDGLFEGGDVGRRMSVDVREQRLPHSGDAGSLVRPGRCDEGGKWFGCEELVRHGEGGAGQERGVRQPPGKHMELRDDREDVVAR
jgi:hypothetical protein